MEGTGPVAADNAGRFVSYIRQRHRKAGRSREIPAARYRKNHLRRHDQDWTAALLFMSLRGVKPDQPDFAALHQISSPPVGLAWSHSRSSLLRSRLQMQDVEHGGRDASMTEPPTLRRLVVYMPSP